MTATLPFARSAAGRRPQTPDVPFAALPLLRRLRDAIWLAARFRAGVRRLEARRDRWGVPRLFFFDRDLQAEWDAVRAAGDGFEREAARRDPAAVAAWESIRDLTDDALTVLS